MQVRAPVTHESLRTVVPACTAVPDSEEVAEVAQKKLGEEEGERWVWVYGEMDAHASMVTFLPFNDHFSDVTVTL